MEIASLTIAVFNEVFDICVFITRTITNAAHQDKDFEKLKFEFSYQQAILDTFGKRFIHGKIIYSLEDVWIIQMKHILEGLKKIVGEYKRLAEKYNGNYPKLSWWRWGKVDREDLRLEPVEIDKPAEPSKKQVGLRNRFSRKLTQLEWALFDRQKLEDIVNDQKSLTEKLVEIMKLTLLLHSSNDIPQVQELSKDAQALGFSNLTNKRLFILDPARGGQAIVLDPKTINFSTVQPPTNPHNTKPIEVRLSYATLAEAEILIEYKSYLRGNDKMDLGVTEDRIRFLSNLLSVEGEREDVTHDSQTSGLHCLGYFHEPEKSRFGLAFNVPQGYDGVPISLNSSISTLSRDKRPTLGQRFEVAYTIGYALMEWFLIDWVHKSISSHSVYFFRKTGAEEWDFSSAYLGGFECARPAHEKSNEVFNHADFYTNVYRHPARQGLPSEGFKKIHDIYAFGVLLLEIGLWTVASSRELFKDENQKPDAIREVLVKNGRSRLGHFMGQKYRDAVLFCFEGTLKVENDDEKQTKLITAFKKNVLDVCEAGRDLL